MLSKRFGIGRIYLEPENPGATRSRQKTSKGSRNIKYIEGWIEFDKKKDAKLAALALNNQKMAGKNDSIGNF